MIQTLLYARGRANECRGPEVLITPFSGWALIVPGGWTMDMTFFFNFSLQWNVIDREHWTASWTTEIKDDLS